jgi:uncharacterized protein YceK
MKRKTIIFVGVITSMLFMGGCATVISGKTQTITVTSKKKKTFTLDGARYTTPAKVLVKRSDKNKVIHVNGCKNVVLKTGVNPVVYGNIVAGGLIGSSVDSGAAAWKYQDSVVLCR